ncbi:MAG: low molecular weight phosphotyrosine protein phosphatase [Winogradskyella sp.]|uniref:low molecular weight protein-tyrosine-phosphatase n=1 Tax=Winogradskyella sp. TaxID=1883156 RepID=UPI000F40E715|nr:low molecular weight protein-tyrosine-phosphatase [Winogradskyella sp.]RNC79776.1 MAG: low molecular weight phosphotyrosine protein phosphatase [Winogradskyella sp.]
MEFKPSKTKILMVCLGNICRSPLAHGILESKLSSQDFFIDSAGTSSYHIGDKPDYRSIAVAKANGIDISTQKSRQFVSADFDRFDIIYAMDKSNYRNIINLAQSESDRLKVKLILDENASIYDKAVPDPYYGDESGFEHVFKILDETCDIIAKTLLK